MSLEMEILKRTITEVLDLILRRVVARLLDWYAEHTHSTHTGGPLLECVDGSPAGEH